MRRRAGARHHARAAARHAVGTHLVAINAAAQSLALPALAVLPPGEAVLHLHAASFSSASVSAEAAIVLAGVITFSVAYYKAYGGSTPAKKDGKKA